MHCELDLKVVAWAEAQITQGRLWQVQETNGYALITWQRRCRFWVESAQVD